MDNKTGSYARWLAQLKHEINRSGEAAAQALGFSVLHPERLLEEALEMSPDDMIAVSELIALMVNRFRFYTHEVPIGVLVDSKAFGDELDRFERLTQRYGMYARYASAIKFWRSHCQAWANYLSHRDEYESYADYLAREFPSHLEWERF